MADIAELLQRMEHTSGAAADEVRRMLSASDAFLLTESPAHPTVRSALNLWRVRQRNSLAQGSVIPGVDELVKTLERVVPHQKKLEQYPFSAGIYQGSVFFDYGSSRFLGYVLGSRKQLDELAPETALAHALGA